VRERAEGETESGELTTQDCGTAIRKGISMFSKELTTAIETAKSMISEYKQVLDHERADNERFRQLSNTVPTEDTDPVAYLREALEVHKLMKKWEDWYTRRNRALTAARTAVNEVERLFFDEIRVQRDFSNF
jgi:hypothetical protein